MPETTCRSQIPCPKPCWPEGVRRRNSGRSRGPSAPGIRQAACRTGCIRTRTSHMACRTGTCRTSRPGFRGPRNRGRACCRAAGLPMPRMLKDGFYPVPGNSGNGLLRRMHAQQGSRTAQVQGLQDEGVGVCHGLAACMLRKQCACRTTQRDRGAGARPNGTGSLPSTEPRGPCPRRQIPIPCRNTAPVKLPARKTCLARRLSPPLKTERSLCPVFWLSGKAEKTGWL